MSNDLTKKESVPIFQKGLSSKIEFGYMSTWVVGLSRMVLCLPGNDHLQIPVGHPSIWPQAKKKIEKQF